MSLNGKHFDVVIIGAGYSGLAAGIRSALYDKSVLLLERHYAPGGLNSFYSIDGRAYDVGLHAVTNYAEKSERRAPLNKILRQLRIPYEALPLSPQKRSRIIFPEATLAFDNDIETLTTHIAEEFPNQLEGFKQLIHATQTVQENLVKHKFVSARKSIATFITEPVLAEMLLMPVITYGSAIEGDMDFYDFCTLFRSIYLEGLSRPLQGSRIMLKPLLKQFRDQGGIKKLRCGVRSIHCESDEAKALTLDNGDTITADKILSSAGLIETMAMCDQEYLETIEMEPGFISFVETLTVTKGPIPAWKDDTIIFYSNQSKLNYSCPEGPINASMGVICLPNNYQYPDGTNLDSGWMRVTALGSFPFWTQLEESQYQKEKAKAYEYLNRKALNILPGEMSLSELMQQTIAQDIFTPRTVKKFTGHVLGSVYGTPTKTRTGKTPVKNLFICGTDQGYLGIIGSMLSGIYIANEHVLKN